MSAQEQTAAVLPPSFPVFPVNSSREAIIDNLRINVEQSYPLLKQRPVTFKPLMIVGGGPSLKGYVPIIKECQHVADILAINGSYKFLQKLGLSPKYFMMIDSRKENLDHVELIDDKTEHLLASQVHPAVFYALKGRMVTMFHLGTDTSMEILKGRKGISYLSAPIGFAGIHAIYLAAALGYRQLSLFGYDFSHADTHHAFDQPLNDSDESVEVTLNDKKYRTTVAMALAAQHFAKAIEPLVNGCELDIQMCSEGLLPDILKEGVE